ncbi:DUF7844 domain-containing protein [Peredibacter starrii]|uniref:DUF4105 domain-containing protein n=1 Tax=Peredibacter starrii TaxID=28202 RepID=A0AAX4HS34_9BACT|nr:DUF4105 domain-containing protein [Peredibacter starrii]WPU66012.1 DUF4105 domain-containing protein [Peredibacter starrii]
MKKLTILSLVLFTALAQAGEVEVRGSEFFKKEVEESLRLLPTNYLDAVKKKVTIEEESLKSDQFYTENLCKLNEKVKFGYTLRHKVAISSRLVRLANSNADSFDCAHGSFQNMLRATIIHELTHVKDNAEKISSDVDFQRIVGMKRVNSRSKKSVMNANTSTSPDAYEFTNLEESLGVNVEYLVLDPEFECRKPATANFLSKKLNIALKGECQKNYKVLAQSAFLEDNYQLATSIDPKRVYQVHYLFAGKGQQLMSRWGHAMFRLIVCAPHRKTVGPECMNDVSHHLALSYRAYMSDMNLNYMKGMFGGYPSQLFVMRFLEIQQEYTKFELRELYSVPLKMTAAQKQDFIDITLERYWTYQGKYYFFDNNCGTETKKHLAVALDEEQADMISSITPLKLYNDIVKHEDDLSDGNLQGLSKDQMIAKRYLIPSMFQDFNSSYQFLRPYMSSFKDSDFNKFLKKTTARARLMDLEKFKNDFLGMTDVNLKKQIMMKLTHLERYLSTRYMMAIPKKAMEMMDKDQDLKDAVMQMGESLKELNVQPWNVVNSLYGVPTADEFQELYPKFIEGRKNAVASSLDQQMENLDSLLGRSYFTKELAEMEDMKKIKTITNEFVQNVSVIK